MMPLDTAPRPTPERAAATAVPCAVLLDLRQANSGDRSALEAMHARCSLQSRIDRWRAPLREIPPTYLADALTGRPGHFALVSRCGRHGLVALGSAVQNAPGLWELGVLVDDGHQRRGIGSAMVAALICSAQTRGARRVLAEVGSERRALLAPLSQFGTVRLRLGPDCITGLVDLPVDEDGGRVGRGTAQSP